MYKNCLVILVGTLVSISCYASTIECSNDLKTVIYKNVDIHYSDKNVIVFTSGKNGEFTLTTDGDDCTIKGDKK